MTIKNMNKGLLGLIITSVILYIINIIDISFFANGFTQITSQLQMVASFIPSQDVQNFNSILQLANNTANVVNTLLVVIAIGSAVASLVSLLVIKLFASRLEKYNSIFNYCGVIIASAFSIYLHYKLIPSFSGLISLLLIILTLAILLISIVYIVISIFGIYNLVMSEEYNVGQAGFDLAKVLSFIIIFYTIAIISIKTSMYLSMTVLVQEIDLAAVIDIMNFIDIDWSSVLPASVLATGIVTPQRIDLVINNFADQYLLDYASQVIQNVVLSFSRTVIFDNLVAYITTLVGGIGILAVSKNNVKFNDYVTIGLLAITALVSFVYIGGLLIDILAIGFVLCLVLISLDIYKNTTKEK